MTEVDVSPRVVRNEDRHRYELWIGDRRVGFSAYREPGDGPEPRTVFTHTEIDPALGGQGLGSRLVQEALDDVIRRGRVIVPICSFVGQQIRATSAYDENVRWPSDSIDE